MTGTSVLGIKYADGVMLAADTLGSYGSLARFTDLRRVRSLLLSRDACARGALLCALRAHYPPAPSATARHPAGASAAWARTRCSPRRASTRTFSTSWTCCRSSCSASTCATTTPRSRRRRCEPRARARAMAHVRLHCGHAHACRPSLAAARALPPPPPLLRAQIQSYLSRVMYNKRNKMNPLYNRLIVAGFKDGARCAAFASPRRAGALPPPASRALVFPLIPLSRRAAPCRAATWATWTCTARCFRTTTLRLGTETTWRCR